MPLYFYYYFFPRNNIFPRGSNTYVYARVIAPFTSCSTYACIARARVCVYVDRAGLHN